MHVKLEEAIIWGKGGDRRRYEAGSVIEVDPDVAELNKFMKPTDDDLFEAPAPKAAKEKAEGESAGESEGAKKK